MVVSQRILMVDSVMRYMTDTPVTSECVQYHVNCANSYALTWIICTASRKVNFTSASEWYVRSVTFISHDNRRLKHPCSGLCKAQGTCEIETTPQSIESTFTGQHESFQYTKVRSL